MDSNKFKILCPINSLVVRDVLYVPQSFTQNLEYFAEENITEQFRDDAIEEKQIFYSKSLIPKIYVKMNLFPLRSICLMKSPSWLIPY